MLVVAVAPTRFLALAAKAVEALAPLMEFQQGMARLIQAVEEGEGRPL
jgi:hypothetical protein